MNHIPDPIERINSNMDRLADSFVDESTCMDCGKKVDYDLICMSPIGDGPAVCFECTGFTDEEAEKFEAAIAGDKK